LWLDELTDAVLFISFEHPVRSSMKVSASTAVTAAVAADPTNRVLLAELLSTAFALKDFRFVMFVSPPLP
jgi:hypothetical protein